MNTLAAEITTEIGATGVKFSGNDLIVTLSDGRAISVPLNKIDWLQWLMDASPEQRNNWSLEPGGFAIYWDDLDDGVEVCHLLSLYSLA